MVEFVRSCFAFVGTVAMMEKMRLPFFFFVFFLLEFRSLGVVVAGLGRVESDG